MKEYQKVLDKYASEFFLSMTDAVSSTEWGKKNIAEKYLQKYWLPEAEYKQTWKPIQDIIFINQDKGMPYIVFSNSYDIIALRGGVLFEQYDFNQLQKCMLKLNINEFVVIQNNLNPNLNDLPILRMKYPVNVSWKEFMSGNYISAVLFDVSLFDYFVFGNSIVWGKYAANDEIVHSLDLIGFKKEYTQLFKQAFPVTEDEEAEIWSSWVPESYKKRLVSTIK